MDEFMQNGMKYNSSISTAFMQFLTKMMGGNAVAGVPGTVASLENKLKNLDNTLNSSTAIGSPDRQLFFELRACVVSPRIFVRSQSLIAR